MRTVKIIVKTKAGKSEITGYDKNKEAYTVSVKAVPEKGKANAEVLKLFRKKYKEPARIIKGLKSREKVLQIG